MDNLSNEKMLKLNLQFFAEGEEGEGEGQEKEDGGQTSDGKEKADKKTDEKEDHMIPKSRFDEVNNNFKSMKEELDAIKEANTKAENERQVKEQEDAEKKGEFENLYSKEKSKAESLKEESKASKDRVESLEGVINGLLESKLESIDKDYHDLIPEGMTPEQKLAWVNNAESKGIFGNKSSNEPLGEQTNPKGNEEVDTNKMNPLQMLMSGYGKK